jgi:hypothetical protein
MGHHRGARSLRPVVDRTEESALDRAEPHHLEVRPADDPRPNLARLAQADHREVDRGEIAEGGQRLDTCAKIQDFRHGEGRILDTDATRALANVNQAIFISIDERSEENTSDDAEDRRIGANSERQGEDNGNAVFTWPTAARTEDP